MFVMENGTVQKAVPRLIVFVIGGVTYSELRIASEIANEHSNWDVIIGGSDLITPTMFLENVKYLK